MTDTTKKILMIIGLVLIAVLLGLGLYYMFRKAIPAPTTPLITEEPVEGRPGFTTSGLRIVTTTGPDGQIITTTLPVAGTLSPSLPGVTQPETISKVVDQPISYTSLNNSNGQMRFYNESDGKFYRLNKDGSVASLSEKVFYGVSQATWANSSDKAILEFPDQTKIIYNFEKDRQYSVPSHWQEFSFSPDDDKIAAKSIGYSPENRWLLSVGDDGTDTKMIEPMGENADKVDVSWSPNRQVVALSKTGANDLGAYRKEVLLVGQNGENFKSITVEGLGFEHQWSPTGQKLLYNIYRRNSDFKPELWIVNSYGDYIGTGRQMLKLNTWADKCAFADDTTLYCAVPKSLPQGAGISPSIAQGTPDDIYKIDLSNGFKTALDLNGEYSIKNIYYDKSENKLFFSDYNQTGLFEVVQ